MARAESLAVSDSIFHPQLPRFYEDVQAFSQIGPVEQGKLENELTLRRVSLNRRRSLRQGGAVPERFLL